jgi:hypothetical protein
MLPDSDFIPGSMKYLVPGNQCRLLDKRRTPGTIEEVDDLGAMFRWRITEFEHKGRYWDVPLEDVIKFQFIRDAKTLSTPEVLAFENLVKPLQTVLTIDVTAASYRQTLREIEAIKTVLQQWFKNSTFFKKQKALNFASMEGSKSLASDLQRYMKSEHLNELEKLTADTIVLNPSSGEWIKGMRIMLAEMGLMSYQDKIARTKDIFEGPGRKVLRRKYLLHRLAFVQTYFELLGISEVELFRGVSSERDCEETRPQSFLSFSFSRAVAESLAAPDSLGNIKYTKVMKQTVPVKQIVMTYLETEAMNREYQEAEALIFPHNPETLV